MRAGDRRRAFEYLLAGFLHFMYFSYVFIMRWVPCAILGANAVCEHYRRISNLGWWALIFGRTKRKTASIGVGLIHFVRRIYPLVCQRRVQAVS